MKDLLGRSDLLRRLALGSLVANVVIVVTGGGVRLTGSGLGCPTWPKCTDNSYVTTLAMGINGVIEYTNRLLGVVVGLIALAVLVSAVLQRPRRRRTVTLAVLVLAGIPAQAVLGGITVLTDLNPWVVACHFLLSIGVIAAAFACWRATREPDGPARAVVPVPLRHLAIAIVIASGAVLAAGTIVTGSGPHAGDAQARRTGLSPESVAQIHADLVFGLLGLVVAAWFALYAYRSARSRVGWLLVIILGQGLIGFVQYFTHVPALLVAAHMAGACIVWLGALSVLFATRERTSDGAAGAAPQPATAGLGNPLPSR